MSIYMNTSTAITDRYRSAFICDAASGVTASIVGVILAYSTKLHEPLINAIPLIIGISAGVLFSAYTLWRRRDVLFLEHGLEGPTTFLRRVVILYEDINREVVRFPSVGGRCFVESRSGRRIILDSHYFSKQQIKEILVRVSIKSGLPPRESGGDKGYVSTSDK